MEEERDFGAKCAWHILPGVFYPAYFAEQDLPSRICQAGFAG
jgi:hypothetical protein